MYPYLEKILFSGLSSTKRYTSVYVSQKLIIKVSQLPIEKYTNVYLHMLLVKVDCIHLGIAGNIDLIILKTFT